MYMYKHNHTHIYILISRGNKINKEKNKKLPKYYTQWIISKCEHVTKVIMINKY